MESTRKTSKPAKSAAARKPAKAAVAPAAAEVPVAAKEDSAPKAPQAARRSPTRKAQPAVVDVSDRHRFIAEAAYYIAERRGFCPGSEIDDWLVAEAEIDRLLLGAGTPH